MLTRDKQDPGDRVDALAAITDEVLREKLRALAEVIDTRPPEEATHHDTKPKRSSAADGNGRRDTAPSRLPHFANAHALPNAFLRAALFPALDTQKPRPFLQGTKLFAVGDLVVTFTGQQYDQGDLDVLAGILEIGTPLKLGSEFRFSSYALLKVLGKQTGGREYVALHKALIRLNSGTIRSRSGHDYGAESGAHDQPGAAHRKASTQATKSSRRLTTRLSGLGSSLLSGLGSLAIGSGIITVGFGITLLSGLESRHIGFGVTEAWTIRSCFHELDEPNPSR